MVQGTKMKLLSLLFLSAVAFLSLAKPLLAQAMEEGAAAPLFPGLVQTEEFSSEASVWQYPGHEHAMLCCESEETLSLAPAIFQHNKLKDFLGAEAAPRLLASILPDDSAPSPKPSPGGSGIFLFFQKE